MASTPATTYRPMPVDFPAIFARVGWEGIEAEVRAHKTTIKRWMTAYGEEELKALRRAYLDAKYAERGHRIAGVPPGHASSQQRVERMRAAGRYVMGRTRAPVGTGKVER